MFKFFKKKMYVHSPVDGAGAPIEIVQDAAFAEKMLGDGFAVIPESEYICAPCAGRLTQIFPTNHAFGITTDDGLEILVHIGIDTVKLKGEGFTRIREAGERVKVGEEIIKVDLELLKKRVVFNDIVVVITNMTKVLDIKSSIGDHKTGDKVLKVTLA